MLLGLRVFGGGRVGHWQCGLGSGAVIWGCACLDCGRSQGNVSGKRGRFWNVRNVRGSPGVLRVVDVVLRMDSMRARMRWVLVMVVRRRQRRILDGKARCDLREAQALRRGGRRLRGVGGDLEEVEQQLRVRQALVWVVLLLGRGRATVLVHARSRLGHVLDVVGPARVVARRRPRVLLAICGRRGAVELGPRALGRPPIVAVAVAVGVGVGCVGRKGVRVVVASEMGARCGRRRGVRGAARVLGVGGTGAGGRASSIGEQLGALLVRRCAVAVVVAVVVAGVCSISADGRGRRRREQRLVRRRRRRRWALCQLPVLRLEDGELAHGGCGAEAVGWASLRLAQRLRAELWGSCAVREDAAGANKHVLRGDSGAERARDRRGCGRGRGCRRGRGRWLVVVVVVVVLGAGCWGLAAGGRFET